MKSTDIFICCSCIAVFLFCHTFIITVLINNAFKTVQQSAKDAVIKTIPSSPSHLHASDK